MRATAVESLTSAFRNAFPRLVELAVAQATVAPLVGGGELLCDALAPLVTTFDLGDSSVEASKLLPPSSPLRVAALALGVTEQSVETARRRATPNGDESVAVLASQLHARSCWSAAVGHLDEAIESMSEAFGYQVRLAVSDPSKYG